MAKTLEELRADLGRFIGMFHTGTVDAIADEIIVDGDGLAHITENDALNAGLAYIRTAVGSAEGESAWIEDYVPPEPSDATELLSNGGFETAGGGGADVFGSWTEVAGDGAIAQDAAIYLFGAKSCKLTSGVLKNTKVYQDIVVVPSTPYRVEIFCYTASTKKASASVIDTGATGGIIVSPLGLQEGAKRIADSENIISVQFFAALGAFILLALVPLIYRRIKKSRGAQGENEAA